MRSAPRFQLMIVPSRVWAVMASSDDSTTVASSARVSSARFRSVMSRMAAVSSTPASVGSGDRLMSTGNSSPDLRSP